MADGEGGVTLKIDANTAAYIAKLSHLADSHEKVGKHVDDWGSAIDHALGRLKEMIGPLALIEGAVEAAEGGFEKWEKNIESAGKSAKELVGTLRQTTLITGENRQAVEEALLKVTSPQSIEQRMAGYSAFRQNAPGSAARIGAQEIGQQLASAATAGYDATQLAGIAGNVEGARGGAGSFDLAALLMARTGSNAGQASEMIRRISEKAGPGGAQALLPYLLASAQAGDKRFSFVNEALSGYNPAFGDVGSYLQGRLAVAPAGQRTAISSRLAGAQADIAGLDGFIGRQAATQLLDPRVAQNVQTQTSAAAAQITTYQKNAEAAEDAEAREANLAQIEATGGAEAFVAGAVHPVSKVFNRAFGGSRGVDPDADHRRRHFRDFFKSNSELEEENRTARLLEEQNAILRTKVLKPDAHQEK